MNSEKSIAYPNHQVAAIPIIVLSREDLLVHGYDDEISDEEFKALAEEFKKVANENFLQNLITLCDRRKIPVINKIAEEMRNQVQRWKYEGWLEADKANEILNLLPTRIINM